MATGAAWMIAMQFSIRALGFVSTLILARLLVPEDFGLVAMGTAIYAFLEILRSFSFDLALIQNQHASVDLYHTAFTLNLSLGVLVSAGLLGASLPAASFYDEPRVVYVLATLALINFVTSAQNIGIVNFRKNLAFRKEFLFQLYQKLVPFVVTISIAYVFRSYWALLIGMLASSLTGFVLSYAMESFRPRFTLSGYRALLGFSKWVFLNNFLIFMNQRGINFFIGKWFGAGPLGYFTVSYQIANLPTTDLVYPITRALFPSYSKISEDLSQLQNGFLGAISAVSIFALPFGAGIVVVAEDLVPLLLGDKWLATIPIIQILGVAGLIRVLQANTGSIYLALGLPRIITIFGGLTTVALYGALFGGFASAGLRGVAWASALATAFTLPLNYFVLLKRLKIPIRTFVSAIWRPMLAASLMSVVLISVRPSLESAFPGLPLRVALEILLGAAVYILALIGFWQASSRPDGGEVIVFRFLQIAFSRNSRSPAA